MRRAVTLFTLFLAGCVAKTPAIQMRFVDESDNNPVMDARVVFCGRAWEGTLTGHGGKTAVLFEIETVTDARGEINIPPKEFDARPFGMSTNYENSQMLIVKPGYATYKITNSGAAPNEVAAAINWQYNGMTIKLKRTAIDTPPPPKYRISFARECGEALLPPVDPRLRGMPLPSDPPKPVRAPVSPDEMHRSAAQPAK